MAQPINLEDIHRRFDYHPPSDIQVPRYEHIRRMGRMFATEIIEKTPPSREQALALTHLEEVVMWANAAIARNE